MADKDEEKYEVLEKIGTNVLHISFYQLFTDILQDKARSVSFAKCA